MPFINVPGVGDLKVTDFEEDDPIYVGDSSRAYDGTLRSAITAVKRTWSGVLLKMTQAEYETLRSVTQLDQHVSISGEALYTTPLTCVLRVSRATYEHNGTSHLLIAGFSVEEV